jgi:hypothetical protein
MKHFSSSCFVWALLILAAVCVFPGGAAVASAASEVGPLSVLPLLGFAGLIDIFDTRTMLEAIEQMKRPANFLRDTFFPRAHQSESDTVDVDIIKGKRRMAPFVSPLSEGKAVENIGFSTSTLKPGYVKPKMPTTAAQLLKRAPGEVLYAGGMTIEQRAAAKLGKDLSDLMDQIDRREEWMAAKALDLGAYTMKIKGDSGDQSVVVDFLMANTHKITLAGVDLWSAGTSDKIGDLQAWANLCRKDSGVNPTDVVFGEDACAAFLADTKILALLDNRRIDMGQINPRQLPNGVSYIGHINAPNLSVDLWSYAEWYLDEDTGVETPMVPAAKVWMGSSLAANTKCHAVIQDMEAIAEGQAAVSRFPKSWLTKDPSVQWLMVQSAPLIALNQPDAFVSASVL